MSEAHRLFAIAWSERNVARRAILRIGLDLSDLEDVQQTAMFVAWRLILRGKLTFEWRQDERRVIRTWLWRVARLVALRHRHQRPPSTDPLPDDLIDDLDPLRRLESREQLRIVGYRLNKYERRVLDGLARGETIPEISARTKMPEGTVATRIRRARLALKKRRER